MKTFIYMNQNIRERNPVDPVIAVARGPSLVYCNEVIIRNRRGKEVARVVFDPAGAPVGTHQVRAWVETGLEVETR